MDVDTSSYPRAAPVQQQNPLDTIGKLQGIQRQQIGISKDKLDLMNQQYQLVNKHFATLLADPELSSDKIINRAQDLVKVGIMPPESFASYVSGIPTQASLKRQYPQANPAQLDQLQNQNLHNWLQQKALQAEDNHNAMNWMYGQQTNDAANGQTTQAQRYLPLQGRVVPAGPPVQQQNPPGSLAFGGKTIGPQPTQLPTGSQPVPGGVAGAFQTPMPPRRPQNALPVNPAESAPYAPAPSDAGPKIGQAFGDLPMVPRGPGVSPIFDEGKKQYSEDIARASSTLQAIKPAQQALKLMNPDIIKGLTGTGPIAEKTTKVLSALQGVGILNTSEPVAARQELVKYLSQYVSNSPIGQRSDAQQVLKEASSPNPNVQTLPALVNLTRNAIAMDRVDAAKSLSFQSGVENKEFGKYLEHKGNFPNNIDQEAFKLDSMPDEEREKFLDHIEKTYSKGDLKKFKDSYVLAKRLKMINQ